MKEKIGHEFAPALGKVSPSADGFFSRKNAPHFAEGLPTSSRTYFFTKREEEETRDLGISEMHYKIRRAENRCGTTPDTTQGRQKAQVKRKKRKLRI